MNAAAATTLIWVGAACAAGAAAAQTPLYRDVTDTHLPSNLAGPCMNAAAGDADGDGDLDLALAMEFRPNILLLNGGAGRFTDGSDRLPRTAHDSEDVAFADFDRDGDLDLVLVSEDDRKDELYINDGKGRFADASERLATDDVSNALAVLDLNGDGAPDVLTGNIGTDRVLINDGRGNFRDETAERWPQDGASRTQDLELADVDADGDLDVIVGNEGQDQLFLNENGRLVDATARSLPARDDETRKIRAVDADGDRDLDLVVANVRFITEQPAQDYLLLNDGHGVFTTADSARLPGAGRSHFTIQAVDVDRDGDQDVLAPSTVFADRETEFIVVATDSSGVTSLSRAAGIDVKDVDRDGDLDAVLIDGDRRRTFVNDGGRLVAPAGDRDSRTTKVFEDVDGDGDGKAIFAATSIELGELASEAPGAATSGHRRQLLQFADLDRDGDVDVVAPSSVTMDAIGDYLVLLNDGSGRFSAASPGTILPASAAGNGFDIEVADFDGDGATDLFLCNRASIDEAPAESGGRQRLLLGARPL